jgi:hypothetical protein
MRKVVPLVHHSHGCQTINTTKAALTLLPLLCLLPPPPLCQFLPLCPHPLHQIVLQNAANKTHQVQTTSDVICAQVYSFNVLFQLTNLLFSFLF